MCSLWGSWAHAPRVGSHDSNPHKQNMYTTMALQV